MAKIRILVDNNKSRILGKLTLIEELRDILKIKSPNAFWSPMYRKRIWDGYVKYITEAGSISTGNLPWLIEVCKKNHIAYTLEDQRESFRDLHEVTELGGMEARSYQGDCIKATLTNTFGGIKFIRGILSEATNAGKNLIAAGIIKSFSSKRQWVFLIDSTVIYDQAKEELQELLPDEDIGWCQGKDIKWRRITVCMVQSLGNHIKKNPQIKNRLATIDGVLVDECDTTMGKKPCKLILANCFNAPIRIGLSGTPLLHKDKTKNQELIAFFGPVIHVTTNKQLVDMGYSAKPHIKILTGYIGPGYPKEFAKEYRRGIIKNRLRNKKIWGLVRKSIDRGRSPVLILIKNHSHIDYLMKTCPADIKDHFNIASVHHKTKGRSFIFEKFKKDKIPILISSMIIRRGKNLPTMKTLINAAGGDSHANVLQIFGRGLRKSEGIKEHLYLYDFWDVGKYLRRHSYHRVIYYKKEGFPVKELYKK